MRHGRWSAIDRQSWRGGATNHWILRSACPEQIWRDIRMLHLLPLPSLSEAIHSPMQGQPEALDIVSSVNSGWNSVVWALHLHCKIYQWQVLVIFYNFILA